MKNKTNTTIDDLVAAFKAAPPEPVKEEPKPEPKPEKVETLDELVSAWYDRPYETEPKPGVAYNENAPVFHTREEVISYYQRRVITAPYMHVVLQQLFGDPKDKWMEVENEANKGLLPWLRTSNCVDKMFEYLDFWNRVKTTTKFKKNNGVKFTDPEWEEFVEHMVHKALSQVNEYNRMCEEEEQGKMEFEFRRNKNNKPRRSVNSKW